MEPHQGMVLQVVDDRHGGDGGLPAHVGEGRSTLARAGLYQVNVAVPEGYVGLAYMSVNFSDSVSNPVPIVIQ
jgi:hypothetical protein